MGEKKKRKWWSRILYVLFLMGLLFATGEFFVRVMGFKPYNPPSQSLQIQPEGSFFQAHPTLGYTGKPGPFTLTLAHPDTPPITFHVTHDDEGYRISEPPSDSTDKRPEIWLFGCSYTHGYGVNDDVTFAWRLQQQFPDYRLRNYAMDGYGTYHSLLQLRTLLASRPAPALVFLGYGAFHDQRNVNSRYWRKALSSQRIAEGVTYPFVRKAEDGSLTEDISPIEYNYWPGISTSALVHFFEISYNRNDDRSLDSYGITQSLIREMHGLCTAKDIPFLLSGIFPDESTTAMLNEMQDEMPVLDVSEGLKEEKYRILPLDLHPNAEGHRLLAERLQPFMQAALPDSLP